MDSESEDMLTHRDTQLAKRTDRLGQKAKDIGLAMTLSTSKRS